MYPNMAANAAYSSAFDSANRPASTKQRAAPQHRHRQEPDAGEVQRGQAARLARLHQHLLHRGHALLGRQPARGVNQAAEAGKEDAAAE